MTLPRPVAVTEQFPKGGMPYRAAPFYEKEPTKEYERRDPFVWFDGGRTGSSLFASMYRA